MRIDGETKGSAGDLVEPILAAVPLPLVRIGPAGYVEAINPAAQRLFRPSTVGRHHIAALRQPALLDAIEQAQRTGEVTEATYVTAEANRETMFKARATPLGTGARLGVLVSFEDMTPLQDILQMRRDFVANVSHELKTPLTALLGFIETLRGAARDDPAAQLRFLEIMAREATRMNRLVGDLLSLSRVESEERMRPREPVDLDGLTRSVRLGLEPMAREAGVDIRYERGEAPAVVPGDPDQLRQVLTNLMENAIKYGGGHPITLSLSNLAYEPMVLGPAVRVDVADAGDGIAPEHIPRLTERFYRVDLHRSRSMGGTGLGLAIVKHIVNRHRGRLRIESEPGEGSVFSVVLPSQ